MTGAYVSGDNLGIKASTTAKKTSKPGKNRISVSWNKDPNYTATLKDGTYTQWYEEARKRAEELGL